MTSTAPMGQPALAKEPEATAPAEGFKVMLLLSLIHISEPTRPY